MDKTVLEEAIQAAEGFCCTLEAAKQPHDADLLTALAKVLVAMVQIDRLQIETDESLELILDKQILTHNLDFAVEELFYETFDPMDPKSVLATSIEDCLRDIYTALKAGIVALNRNPNNAPEIIWEWQNGYRFHWGRHLVNVIRYMVLCKKR